MEESKARRGQSNEGAYPRLLVAFPAAYVGALLLLALFGFYGFVSKTVVVPALFLAAALAGQLRLFVRDWAVFLSAVILVDSVRGLIYVLIDRFDLPVYMVYAIDWERALLAGSTLPHLLQQAWLGPDERGLLPRVLVVVHASHFLFFLFFALLVWLTRAAHFRRFKLAMLMTMYLGLLGYLLVPTIPPWMAADQFEVLPPVERTINLIYNLWIPALQGAFNTNHIAAMPSLHGAFPALLAFIAFYHYRWRSWPAFLYAALVFTAITYLGEHYLVDVLAGVVLAAICYGVAYHTDALGRLPGLRRFQKPERAEDIPPGTHATLPAAEQLNLGPVFLGTVILLLLAEFFGLYTVAHRRPFTPSPRFIERELEGRSPMAGLYWGHLAFSRGDLATAKQKMDAALPQLAGEGSRRLSNYLLGRSRFQPQTLEAARRRVRTLSPSAMGRWEGLLRALTELEEGRRDECLRILDSLPRQATQGPEFQYWKIRLEFEASRLDAEQYRARMDKLTGGKKPEKPSDARP